MFNKIAINATLYLMCFKINFIKRFLCTSIIVPMPITLRTLFTNHLQI